MGHAKPTVALNIDKVDTAAAAVIEAALTRDDQGGTSDP
jgi:hypothetical protein